MLEKIAEEIEFNYKFYYAIAYRHLRNHHDACDAVQNACFKIAKYCPKYISSKKLRGWISIVCSNESKTMISKRKRDALSDSLLLRCNEPISPYGNPDDLEFYYEGLTYAAIQVAPKEYQLALNDYYKDSLSLLNAAQKHGIPEATLRYWRNKVEKKLKEFL